MQLKAYRYIGDPNPIVADDLSVVIVEGPEGSPAMVACQIGEDPHNISLSKLGDSDFSRACTSLGIDRTVIVEDLEKLLKSEEQLPPIF